MKHALVFISVLAMVGCGGDDGGDDGEGGSDGGNGNPSGEPAALAGITRAHNDAREIDGVGPLVWDDDLAAIAQAWANNCQDNDPPAGLIDHNPNRGASYPDSVGENVYGSSGSVSGPAVVNSWAGEKANYDYASNTCSSVCGHYTQVVWAATTKVGCAVSNCAGLRYNNSVVCNYSPAGNNGNRPF